MKKYLAFTITMIFLLPVSIGLTGCGARGNQFSGFSQPPKNEGILYIYRPSAFGRGGVKFTVYDVTNGKVIGTLRNGGYIRYKTKPGKRVISIRYEYQWAWGAAGLATSLMTIPITGMASPIIGMSGEPPPDDFSINIRKNDISCIRWNASADKKVPNGSVDKSTCRKEMAKTKLSSN